jgi:hypothetical protein
VQSVEGKTDRWASNDFDSAAMAGALDASIYCANALWAPIGAQKTMPFVANILVEQWIVGLDQKGCLGYCPDGKRTKDEWLLAT